MAASVGFGDDAAATIPMVKQSPMDRNGGPATEPTLQSVDEHASSIDDLMGSLYKLFLGQNELWSLQKEYFTQYSKYANLHEVSDKLDLKRKKIEEKYVVKGNWYGNSVKLLKGSLKLLGGILKKVGNIFMDIILALLALAIFDPNGEFLMSILNLIVDLGMMLLNLFISMLPAMIGVIVTVLPKLAAMLGRIIEQVIPVIIGMVPLLIQVVLTLVKTFIGLLPGIFLQVVNAIVTLLPVLLEGILTLVVDLLQFLVQQLPILLGAILKALPIILKAIINALPVVINAIVTAIPLILEALIGSIDQIIDALIQALPLVVEALIKAIPMILIAIVKLLPVLFKAVIHLLSKIFFELVPAILQNLWALLTGLWDSLFGSNGTFLSEAWNSITDIFSQLLDWYASIWDRISGPLLAVITFPFKLLIKMLKFIFNLWKKVFIDPFLYFINAIGGVVQMAFGPGSILTTIFDFVKGIIESIRGIDFGALLGAFSLDNITNFAKKAIEAVQDFFKDVLSLVVGLATLKTTNVLKLITTPGRSTLSAAGAVGQFDRGGVTKPQLEEIEKAVVAGDTRNSESTLRSLGVQEEMLKQLRDLSAKGDAESQEKIVKALTEIGRTFAKGGERSVRFLPTAAVFPTNTERSR